MAEASAQRFHIRPFDPTFIPTVLDWMVEEGWFVNENLLEGLYAQDPSGCYAVVTDDTNELIGCVFAPVYHFRVQKSKDRPLLKDTEICGNLSKIARGIYLENFSLEASELQQNLTESAGATLENLTQDASSIQENPTQERRVIRRDSAERSFGLFCCLKKQRDSDTATLLGSAQSLGSETTSAMGSGQTLGSETTSAMGSGQTIGSETASEMGRGQTLGSETTSAMESEESGSLVGIDHALEQTDSVVRSNQISGEKTVTIFGVRQIYEEELQEAIKDVFIAVMSGLIVRRDWRKNQGVGRLLIEHLRKKLQRKVLYGFSCMESFQDHYFKRHDLDYKNYTIMSFEGEIDQNDISKLDIDDHRVFELNSSEDFDVICKYDEWRHVAPRKEFLKKWFNPLTTTIYFSVSIADLITGYGCIQRVGSTDNYLIGPVICDTYYTGQAIMYNLLQKVPEGKTVRFDFPKNENTLDFVESFHLDNHIAQYGSRLSSFPISGETNIMECIYCLTPHGVAII